ncbi:ketopantoate reductase PanE/ApbA C terminal-domain-containing protein [Entophlyctis helioformis]|nr:ketopantoate reductase PanE/ApbA C terminal-domain-containing protein [Entophlyctis helioformis]
MQAERHTPTSFAVLGAGLIGCYVAARLLHAGHTVHLIGRPSLQAKLARTGGLSFSSISQPTPIVVPHDRFKVYASLADMAADGAAADHVLVTLKRVSFVAALEDFAAALSAAGADADADARRRLPSSFVTFMNGPNPRVEFQRVLPQAQLTVGMWPFNVVEVSDGVFHQSVQSTAIELQDTPTGIQLASVLEHAGIPTHTTADISAVLYGKMLLNLNNAVNALAAMPLRQQLRSYDYRCITSRCMHETLAVFHAAAIVPVPPLPNIPVAIMPWVLVLPDAIYSIVARSSLDMDEMAVTSMHQDLQHGRRTEIAYLQGHIADLGRQTGVDTPVCDAIVRLVRQAEQRNADMLASGRPCTMRRYSPQEMEEAVDDGRSPKASSTSLSWTQWIGWI